MKDFLINYWRELVEGLIAIITLLIVILKKRGKLNPGLEQVYYYLPEWISKAEQKYGSGNGEDKKKFVLSIADDFFFHLTGIHIFDSSYYLKLVSKQIEKILLTPSRKEGK